MRMGARRTRCMCWSWVRVVGVLVFSPPLRASSLALLIILHRTELLFLFLMPVVACQTGARADSSSTVQAVMALGEGPQSQYSFGQYTTLSAFYTVLALFFARP
ncbi:hypothetical protein BDV98DRAFT_576428 [Pterulicium gracile]|uniref:Uncharacterized protein n=1 Tax=Pterulicium gracile TaxID=1884261 RepID=A0A5C3Q7M8_9AGAR|nr:hypothetical protein BDV98DRAFT_576428 [Pterula gracilis]